MNTSLFLQEFRNVEGVLRGRFNMTYLDFENTVAPPDMKKKMQVCRILRNYLAHEQDGDTFISVSLGEIEFLQKLCCYLRNFRG